MRRRRLRAASVLVLLLLAGLARADESWYEARAGGLTLVSNAGEDAARRLLERLLVFRRVLVRALADVRLDASVPASIYAFRDFESFAPFLPGEDERAARASGFFRRGDVMTVIGFDMSAPVSPERTLFHEYVHFVASGSGRKLPLWLEEGLAELYASVRLEEGSAELGAADWRHSSRLQKGLLPLSTLLGAQHGDPVASDPTFYAQSWLMAHYFLVARKGGGPEALSRRPSGAERDLARLEESLRAHASESFETLTVELPAVSVAPPVEAARLTRAQVLERWAELFLATDRPREA